jgi:hypothetical protein
MESAVVGLKISPFTFFDQVQEFLRLAIFRDSFRIARQTLVLLALVTLDCLSSFGHFPSLPNEYMQHGHYNLDVTSPKAITISGRCQFGAMTSPNTAHKTSATPSP